MSATIMTGGGVAKNQTKLLADDIGVGRKYALMPLFTFGSAAMDLFESEIAKKAGKVKMNVVVNPETGEKRTMLLSDLLTEIEKVTSARNEKKTYMPLTAENNNKLQDWLDLAIFSVGGFSTAESFNVNPVD